jgi:hypothetical protein
MAKQNKAKKAYKKPTVTQVKLEMGEAVLQSCKVDEFDMSGKVRKIICGIAPCVSAYGS